MVMIIIGAGHLYAQPTLIDNEEQSFSIVGDVHMIDDDGTTLTVQNIISKLQEGTLPAPVRGENIDFDNTSSAHWLVIPIINSTERRNWYLDFGDLHEGRSGTLKKLLIYETEQKKIIFNRLQNRSKNLYSLRDENYIPVTLPAQSRSNLIVYLQPNGYKTFSVVPTLHSSPPSKQTALHMTSVLQDHLLTVFIISVITIMIGFALTRGVGYIPLLFYYLITAAWFYGFETRIIIDSFILDTVIPLFPTILSLVILLTTFFTVPTRHSHHTIRIPLVFMTIVNVILLVILSIFPDHLHFDYGHAPMVISILTHIVCVLFLIKTQSDFIKPFAYCLAGWLICLIIGQTMTLVSTLSGSDAAFLINYADRMMIYPQYLFLFVGVIISVQISHNYILKKIRRENERARSIIHAQKTRDEMDHSRLLKVIEREREIMEELRARESERTEQMRAAKIMADEANQSKSAFLAVVSHEIRTPMTGLIGMLRMLENTPLSKDQKEYVEVVKDSTDTMLALLNDILDFSKIEKGVLDLENIEFDLKRILMAVTTLMKTHADQKNIALNLVIAPDIPHSLYGDPTRLRQVFLNLVGNALKFTQHGHVTIKVDLNHLDDNKCVIDFAIEDTGIGISEEAQKNLFAPFAQADSSISRKYGGTGLGLAICKTLVEGMGGKITLKSTEGVGTTFFFTLEFSREADSLINNTHISATSSSAQKVKPLSILIVDDNDVNLKVISEYLKDGGHTLVTAESGQTCLDILKSKTDFDLILMDIEMPDISGLDLAAQILGDDATPQIPIIAMTGNIGQNHIKHYKETGFKGLIAKPFDPDQIQSLLQKLVTNPTHSFFDESDQSEDSNETSSTEKAVSHKTDKKKKPQIGKALDEVLLTNLKNGLGTQKTRDLLVELFEKADEIIVQFYEAIATQDRDAIYARAHELKGMCANFGLKAVSEKAREIETVTRDDDYAFDDFNPHIEDLKTLMERSKIAIDDFFGT